jgi:hypothetical protein
MLSIGIVHMRVKRSRDSQSLAAIDKDQRTMPTSNAADITRQAIRVLGHHLDGVGTIDLENPHSSRRPDAMAVQEKHDLANDLLLGPAFGDALGANLAK